MQCYIYKSLKKDGLYLFINQKDDFSKVPKALFKNLGKLAFVMELTLTPERRLARVDVNKVMASLTDQGFFIQMPPALYSEPSLENRLH